MFNRFRMALQTELGTVFFALMALLITLGIAYFILKQIQRRKDLYRFLYSAYYEKAEELSEELTFDHHHKAELFGRETVVTFKTGRKGVCLIPPPTIAKGRICDRYTAFLRAFSGLKLSVFAPVIWEHHEECLVIVEGNRISLQGAKTLPITTLVKDKKLSQAEKEGILSSIAQDLAVLHKQQVETGEFLYHGMLLPRYIFVDNMKGSAVRRTAVSLLGIPFAMGPVKVYQRLQALKEGVVSIEKHLAEEILQQMTMLSPEQRNPNKLEQTGPSSDFYTFGCLAILLFTGAYVRDKKKINWSLVPEKWQPFVKGCLEEEPEKRPADFHDLEEWLEDPELGLTQRIPEQEVTDEPSVALDDVDFSKIILRPTEIDLSQFNEEKKDLKPFDKHMQQGSSALKLHRWEQAHEHFQQAVSLNPKNPQALTSLAISYYEIGEIGEAERFYIEANQLDPSAGKHFRRHIAFRNSQ